MKRLFFLIFTGLLLSSTSFSQHRQRITLLANLVDSLSGIKTQAESIRETIHSWKSPDYDEGKRLYNELKKSMSQFIDKVAFYIRNSPRDLKMSTLQSNTEALNKNSKALLDFYLHHYKSHPEKQNFVFYKELIELIFDVAQKIPDFIGNINKRAREPRAQQIEKYKLVNWDGHLEASSISSTPTSTSGDSSKKGESVTTPTKGKNGD